MNKAKKIICVITLALSAMACAGIANAAGYTPLVRIPGLPATGTVDLSMYMIGLYNFLLSIVGIVAVMMLIFGGMRYITAMGSSSAISSAKDIVTSALLGLLLALISWVIVSTINPDILYIQNPTSKLQNLFLARDVACTKSNDPCVCNDLFTPPSPPTTPESCSNDCRRGAPNHCLLAPADSTKCIAIGADDDGVKDDSGVLQCNCVDGEVVAKGAAATCNAACANNCGWEYLVVTLRARDQFGDDTGNWESDHEIFHPDKVPNSELWDFYLTNDGRVEGFMVTGTSFVTGGITYECAIFERNVDVVGVLLGTGWDEADVIWVRDGISIGSYGGESLYWDVEKSADKNGIASPYVWCNNIAPDTAPSCDIDVGLLGGPVEIDNDSPTSGWGYVFHAKYGDSYANKCVNESCSFSTVPEYRPSMSIVCRNGKWFPTPYKN